MNWENMYAILKGVALACFIFSSAQRCLGKQCVIRRGFEWWALVTPRGVWVLRKIFGCL